MNSQNLTTSTMNSTPSFVSLFDGNGPGSTTYMLQKFGMKELPRAAIPDADIIVFNGGADIGTTIYGEQPAQFGGPKNPSNRDHQEIDIFNRWKGKKFFFGICRGAQLLNCLNGGTLWQDVNNHERNHSMVDLATGKVIHITSTHHQMMRPSPNGKVIGVSYESTHKTAEHERETGPLGTLQDVEIVWYPENQSLCIQGHPEYVPDSFFAKYSMGLIDQYITEANHVAA